MEFTREFSNPELRLGLNIIGDERGRLFRMFYSPPNKRLLASRVLQRGEDASTLYANMDDFMDTVRNNYIHDAGLPQKLNFVQRLKQLNGDFIDRYYPVGDFNSISTATEQSIFTTPYEPDDDTAHRIFMRNNVHYNPIETGDIPVGGETPFARNYVGGQGETPFARNGILGPYGKYINNAIPGTPGPQSAIHSLSMNDPVLYGIKRYQIAREEIPFADIYQTYKISTPVANRYVNTQHGLYQLNTPIYSMGNTRNFYQ